MGRSGRMKNRRKPKPKRKHNQIGRRNERTAHRGDGDRPGNMRQSEASRVNKITFIPKEELKHDDVSEASSEEGDNFKNLLSSFNVVTGKNFQDSDDSDDSCSEASNDKQPLDTEEVAESQDYDDTEMNSMEVIEVDEDECNPSQNEDEASDPFVCHFTYDLSQSLLQAVSTCPQMTCTKHEHWPCLGKLVFSLPQPSKGSDTSSKLKLAIEESCTFAEPGRIPNRIISEIDWFKLHVKSQIHNNIHKANILNIGDSESDLTPLQKELFAIINNYQDIYYPLRTINNGEEVRFVYCLHAVNHLLKTRIKIIHHNNKLQNKFDVPDEFRDQGLVRPKVLIVLPFKDSAYRVIKMICSIILHEEKANVINKSRFVSEFTGNELVMPYKNPRPEDYEKTFSGNTDDNFRIGLAVTKKSVKLYTDFYSSDIIVASPLGLRVIIGAEGESNRDYDFLASLEVLIFDQTEIFLMQNWDHVLHLMEHMHLQPKEAHDTNFSRVRSWAVNGWTRFYRQTLVFSSHVLPEINSIVNKKCHNYAGKVRVLNEITTGSICQIVVQLPQVFRRFSVVERTDNVDTRFNMFIKKILPQFMDSINNHVLVYIPSYFDFVRVRNYFKKEDIDYVQICEYSKENRIARARDLFYHKEAHFLLYTERAHFFRRMRVKGIRHLIFYQLPNIPHFYSEMCNLMNDGNQNMHECIDGNKSVTVMYAKCDAHQLSAVVGTQRASRMLASDQDVHMFVSGE